MAVRIPICSTNTLWRLRLRYFIIRKVAATAEDLNEKVENYSKANENEVLPQKHVQFNLEYVLQTNNVVGFLFIVNKKLPIKICI